VSLLRPGALFQALVFVFLLTGSSAAQNCTTLSASDSDSYWEAVGKCPACNQVEGCGYCLSTLQCLAGTTTGPLNNTPCPSWVTKAEACPPMPNCAASTDCSSCAQQDQCAWCASEGICTTISEAFSMDCRGLVFEPPCPTTSVSGIIKIENHVYINC